MDIPKTCPRSVNVLLLDGSITAGHVFRKMDKDDFPQIRIMMNGYPVIFGCSEETIRHCVDNDKPIRY